MEAAGAMESRRRALRRRLELLGGARHDVAERAMQIFGGKGISGDTPIAEMYVIGRLMRIADGPDEVHMNQLAKLTMAQAELTRQNGEGGVTWYGD